MNLSAGKGTWLVDAQEIGSRGFRFSRAQVVFISEKRKTYNSTNSYSLNSVNFMCKFEPKNAVTVEVSSVVWVWLTSGV